MDHNGWNGVLLLYHIFKSNPMMSTRGFASARRLLAQTYVGLEWFCANFAYKRCVRVFELLIPPVACTKSNLGENILYSKIHQFLDTYRNRHRHESFLMVNVSYGSTIHRISIKIIQMLHIIYACIDKFQMYLFLYTNPLCVYIFFLPFTQNCKAYGCVISKAVN